MPLFAPYILISPHFQPSFRFLCLLFAGVGAPPGHVQRLRSTLVVVRGGFQTCGAQTQSCRTQAGGGSRRRAQGGVWAGPGAVAELACGGRWVLLTASPAAAEWAAGGTVALLGHRNSNLTLLAKIHLETTTKQILLTGFCQLLCSSNMVEKFDQTIKRL